MKETNESLWRKTSSLQSFPTLSSDITTDICVVGGGITGLTTAYLLGNEGLNVTLIEADELLNGTTGHTTAKVTAQHGLIYDELINHIGLEKAKAYYEANLSAVEFIKETVSKYNINCGFSEQDAIIYSMSSQYAKKVEKEYEAYQKIGISSQMTNNFTLPMNPMNMVIMNQQYQFHPLLYLQRLVEEMTNKNVLIYEKTAAMDILEEDHTKVLTKQGHKITCKHVIIASHFPFYDAGFYFTRMYAERSYVIAVKDTISFPEGMFYSADTPRRSLRTFSNQDEKLILVGGESHKTGQGIHTNKHYDALKRFSSDILQCNEVRYQWSAQDLSTIDKIPYVGEMRKGKMSILVATGYRKWGMTNGTAAAMLIRDMITEKDNPYKGLFNPSRFYADPSIKNFISANMDVAKHLIKGKFSIEQQKNSLDLNEATIKTVDGKKVGCFMDESGEMHVVDTTCTHLGCEVAWNNSEKTWDCPCHGSRFSYNGDVIEGPAIEPLKKIE